MMHPLLQKVSNFASRLPIGFITPAHMGYIGLDFALESCHMVQLEKDHQGNISFYQHVTIDYNDTRENILSRPEALKAIVKAGFKKGEFKGNQVITILPPNIAHIFPVHYKVNQNQDPTRAIIQLLEERLDGDLSNYVIDYMPIRTQHKGTEQLALVAYASEKEVIDYLELLREAGLWVKEVEVGPVAIRRLVTAMELHKKTVSILVINFGVNVSYLTVLSGRRLLFDQEVAFGEHEILKALSNKLDISEHDAADYLELHGVRNESKQNVSLMESDDDMETLIHQVIKPIFTDFTDEVMRTLVYASSISRGDTVNQVYIIGGVARWHGIEKLLENMLNIPVDIIPPPSKIFRKKTADKHESERAPEVAVATGLALRGIYTYD